MNRPPKPLAFDFARAGPRSRWAPWLLLAIGSALVFDIARACIDARENVAHVEARLARLARQPASRPESSGPAPEHLRKELQSARATIVRLALPWRDLFHALDEAQVDTIALLSLEPDPDGGAVTVGGEARDYAALLTYVALLEETRPLKDVHVARHEVRQGDPRKPIAFSIRAAWLRKS
jgi:hypothetical protein